MQFSTIFSLGALVAAATASPVARAACGEGQTQYCSVDAGCACVDWPSDCTAFYDVQPGDNCVPIAQQLGNLTVTQLYLWNKNVGQDCTGLQAYVPLCINAPNYTFVPPVQPDYGTHYTAAQIPVPIMHNSSTSCTEYELVAPGTRNDQLAAENNVTEQDISDWNSGVAAVWAGYWACVAVSSS